MGRKGRRNRSSSYSEDDDDQDDESENEQESIPHDTHTTDEGRSDNKGGKLKDLEFAQRREIQRQQAAEKRRSKQKCYLCGKSGHVRRQCPGIADDGRGMSRFKGKSDPKTEKQKYQSRRQGRSSSGTSETSIENLVASLEYPEEFTKDGDLVYFDVHCDVAATIEYLRSGRGKTKISHVEAVEEYQVAMRLASERSNIKAIISKTFLMKPDRPWINPITFDIETVKVFFSLGLNVSWKIDTVTDEESTIQSLISTFEDCDEVIAFYASLDYTANVLENDGMDISNQASRFLCCCEAAGRTNSPLQIQVLPGAASLDPEQVTVVGTDYAKVLLDLQANLTSTITKYPNLKIHLVGWSGRASHMMAMLQAFPNNILALGLDGAVTFSKAAHLHECAFEVPLDRLVLETTNIIPSNVANTMGRYAFSQSGWWPFLAESVADYKKVEALTHVVSQVYENSLRLYPQLLNLDDSTTKN